MLELASAGKTNAEIADSLGISREGVRYHLKELHAKLATGSDRKHLLARIWALVPLVVWRTAGAAATPSLIAGIVGLGILAYTQRPNTGGEQETITYTTWEGALLADFAVPGRISEAELQALNPDVPTGPLSAGIEVVVPRLPDQHRIWIQPTPSP